MSTSPDALVNLLSRWLARHVGDRQLVQGLSEAEEDHLSPDQAELVGELLSELGRGESRGELERLARETLEALAVG